MDMKDLYNFQRAQKVKLVFAHHCNIQMFIHAKSLEIYANMHQKIQSVDIAEELLRKHPTQPNMVKLLREQGHQVSAIPQNVGGQPEPRKIKIKGIEATSKSVIMNNEEFALDTTFEKIVQNI